MKTASSASARRLLAFLSGSAVLLLMLNAHAQEISLMDEPPVTFTGRPGFYDYASLRFLTLVEGTNNYKIPWNLESEKGVRHYFTFTLDTNRTYEFTVGRKYYMARPNNVTNSELRKVVLDGQVLFDLETCNVHQVKLEWKDAPQERVVGLPSTLFYQAKPKLFPHYDPQLAPTLPLPGKSPRIYKQFICPKCNEAFKQWKDQRAQPVRPPPVPRLPEPPKSLPIL